MIVLFVLCFNAGSERQQAYARFTKDLQLVQDLEGPAASFFF